MDAPEKINGLIALISVLPKYNRTQYPYNQFTRNDLQYTQHIITTLAKKDSSTSSVKLGGMSARIVFYT